MAKKSNAIEKVNDVDGGGIIPVADFKDVIDEGGFRVVRDFKFEVDGPALRGFMAGQGGDIEMMDEATGEAKTIRTWLIRDPKHNIMWQVMGSHGLEKFIAKLADGKEVCIKLVGQKEVGKGRRMNDFVVGVK